ncbi:MAG: long-chain fatty acid--CoA ligase [Proteobacteria bacterium]|nr:long-chain fatty acid--CoA ligase [Pseudomonadota bacterium]MBU1583584.1 long-chain fatty acid--CoA ligase [Pseudomonadota bacterium]MBU2628670.1 long-chain fatty acid--CoA ligase [Pseudomonadota bacterium]
MKQTTRYQDKPWLKFYDKDVPESIAFKNTLLHEFLEKNSRDIPDHTAFIFQGYKMTFKAFNEMVDRFAAFLVDQGVKKKDAISILLPNVIPCPVSFYAILKIGAIAVMNNPLYSDRELLHQFNDSNSTHLITLDLLANRMIDLRPKTAIKTIVITSIGDYLPFPKNLLFPLVAKKKKLAAKVKPAHDIYKWKTVINHYPPSVKTADITFDDVAMYQYTGGTTGVSKGAVLTHGNLSCQTQQIDAWLPGFKEARNEVMIGALPFFHVMGLTVSMNFAISKGWTNILVPKPQPEPLLEAMEKFKPTFAPLVPTMFIGILNHKKLATTDLSSIKACVSGSAPLPVEVIKGFEEKTGATIIEAFGMTESSPATHVNPFENGLRKVGSIGIPLPDTLCRIVDLNDPLMDLGVGDSGEMVIQGPQVMKGYLNMPGETKKTIVNGWLHTGDIAYMDEDGYFFIVDRIKDMIISGGYNVYPRDIDEVLFEHPKVQEACAIGVPHPTRGEQIKAFIVLVKGEQATGEEMIDYCKPKLAAYKLPTQIEFIDELPKTNVGKVLRKDLRAMEIKKRS